MRSSTGVLALPGHEPGLGLTQRTRQRQLALLRVREAVERALERQLRAIALQGSCRVKAAQCAQLGRPVRDAPGGAAVFSGQQAGDVAASARAGSGQLAIQL
jgi:hypothetical protein